MLPIGFAALLGLVLGRYFRVAVLAPGVVATTIFAAFVDWPNGAGASATLAAVVIAAVSLQLGYLVGTATAHSSVSDQLLMYQRSRSTRRSISARSRVSPRSPATWAAPVRPGFTWCRSA